MGAPEPPFSILRVLECIVAVAILLLIAGSWVFTVLVVLGRAWFGSRKAG